SFSHIILERTFGSIPQHLLAALSLTKASDALHVRSLYQADARAFAFEDRWVNLAAIPAFRDAPLNQISANEWLVQNAPFSHGTLDYSAAPASPDEAAHLDCAPGTPVMRLERTTFSPDAPVTTLRLTYAPGYRLNLNI
ncbi:MAG: GntR family transcriptional regulator, partial [Rhodobacteraceae bacterium]